MKSLRFALGLFCIFAVAAPAFASTVTLPAGTKVTVQTVSAISSGNAVAGQTFTFMAAAPVIVNNRVVIAKGAKGTGHVVKVSKAQGKSAGQMTLAFSTIHAVDGSNVSLSETTSSQQGNPEKGKASTATIAATIALGPLGLFAHNMVKGKDVVIQPSQTFPAWVAKNTSVSVH